jgi:hypothetical protein
VVADELYEMSLPLVAISESDFAGLHTGQQIEIDNSGEITIT